MCSVTGSLVTATFCVHLICKFREVSQSFFLEYTILEYLYCFMILGKVEISSEIKVISTDTCLIPECQKWIHQDKLLDGHYRWTEKTTCMLDKQSPEY